MTELIHAYSSASQHCERFISHDFIQKVFVFIFDGHSLQLTKITKPITQNIKIFHLEYE